MPYWKITSENVRFNIGVINILSKKRQWSNKIKEAFLKYLYYLIYFQKYGQTLKPMQYHAYLQTEEFFVIGK